MISQEIIDIKKCIIPHFNGNLIRIDLFCRLEALWPKIWLPDLKTFVYFFFAHPLVNKRPKHLRFLDIIKQNRSLCKFRHETYQHLNFHGNSISAKYHSSATNSSNCFHFSLKFGRNKFILFKTFRYHWLFFIVLFYANL